jgi:hypothetical protein
MILLLIQSDTVFSNTGHTQNNGAVLWVYNNKTAPFFCVCPVYEVEG